MEDTWTNEGDTELFPLVDELDWLSLATEPSVASIGMGSSEQRNTSIGP